MTKRQAVLLRVFALWTIWVWSTRIWNIVRDPEHDAAFKAVHSILAGVSIVLAVAALVVVRRVRRRALGAGAAPEQEPVTTSRGA